MGGAAPLPHVAAQAGADDVVPVGEPPAAAGNDVVEAELLRVITMPAILAAVLVAQKDVAAVELDDVFRKQIVPQQPDHARNLNRKIHRADPVLVLLGTFDARLPQADLAPALEVIRNVRAVLDVDDLGQVLEQQTESPPHRHDLNGHIQPVQDQHTRLHRRARPRCHQPTSSAFCNTNGRPLPVPLRE